MKPVDEDESGTVEEEGPPRRRRRAPNIDVDAILHASIPARYTDVKPIGSGGQGRVFEAKDTRGGRVVALKFFKGPDRVLDAEARALARIPKHPHIVDFHDIHDGWLSMELVDGVNLRQRLGDGPIEFELGLELMTQLAMAVEHAHANGVLHCDLKPSNLMVVRGVPALKVLDFGLAQSSAASRSARAFQGTRHYAAPEQLEHGRLDALTDIWAIGAILYETLTGRMAWADTQVGRVPRLPEDPWGRHRVIQPILDRTLVEREARYPSATALREALEGAQGACERESLRSRLARINQVFEPNARLVHVPEPAPGAESFLLDSRGPLDVSAVQARIEELNDEFWERWKKKQRAINDAHAVVDLLASDLTADPPRFSYRTTDYHAIRALRERFVQPRILSASAVIVLPGAKQVVLHRRSPSSATYPSALHTFGGAFKPEVIDDAWDRSLEDAICREFTEESGIDRARAHGLDSVHRCPKLIALEPPTGFVQVVYLGLAIDKVAFRPNWEGKEVCLTYDELATELIDPRGWVPTGLVHVLAWLAAGAPGAGRDASFDGRSARELADLILDTMQLRAKAARGR